MTRALRAGAAVAALVFVPTPAAAQAVRTGSAARVTFRALSDEGQVVPDLKTGELSLKVNGKVKSIESLSLVRATSDAPVATGAPLPRPYSSNVAVEQGRVLYVFIDDESITAGREAGIKSAVRMLAAELSPADRLGVLSTQGTLNIRPGGDFVKVRTAVDAFAGRAGTTENENDSKCRTRKAIGALGTMLSLGDGTPTIIVAFSSGVSIPETKQVRVGSQTASGTSDLCPVEPEDFTNLSNMVSAARADLYLFQVVDGLSMPPRALDAGIESLAGATGAQLLRVQGNPQPGISRVLRETAAYYVATFTPEPGERNGLPLRVELKAARDKVKLRTPPSLVLAKEAAAKGAPTPKDMLRTAGEYRDLPLRATSYASRLAAGGGDVKVVALFETPDAATLSAASVGLFDEKGTLKKQWTATKDDLARKIVRADLQAPPGAYRVRVAAVDATGRAGTTDDDLKAETVRADPLTLSALVIGTQQQGAGFAPRLEFTNEAIAIGLLEIYGVPVGATVTVGLDVASSSEGQPLATAETQIGKGSGEDARMAIGGFGIGDLPPGDYLMRAVVSLDGKPVGRVMRTLRKAK